MVMSLGLDRGSRPAFSLDMMREMEGGDIPHIIGGSNKNLWQGVGWEGIDIDVNLQVFTKHYKLHAIQHF